jgi:hypothetical protein
MDFGDNICVGDIGRSGLNIDIQIKAGLDKADTEFIAIAEHDCVYSKEHFDWVPPDNELFYYNTNNWLLQYHSHGHPEFDGLFSTLCRKVQSQLIADRGAMLEATKQKIAILSDPAVKKAWPERSRLGEPGTTEVEHAYKVFKYIGLMDQWPAAKAYIEGFKSGTFETKIPNLDIRHGGNLTGARRASKRRWELEPWGTLEDVLNGG